MLRAGKRHGYSVPLAGLVERQIAAIVDDHMPRHAEVEMAMAG